MIRAVAIVAQAIASMWPLFPAAERAPAAAELCELSEARAFDPFTAVAVIHNESRGNTAAIGSAGEVGLGQVKPQNAAHAEALLDWRINLAATVGAFGAWRSYCQRTVGTGLAVYWLQGYQGFDGSRRATCGHRLVRGRWRALPVPDLTLRVLAVRAKLARTLGGRHARG